VKAEWKCKQNEKNAITASQQQRRRPHEYCTFYNM